MSDKFFWRAFEKRDFIELEKYTLLNSDITAEALTFASIKCLKNNDIDMLEHIHFPTRLVMLEVADEPIKLERLLFLLLKESYSGDIPEYVWKKASPKSKKLLKNFEKERISNL